ncbi:MAG: hypothetical protein FWF06_01445, partial [Symbiobacteriaceae bacterium]|nr:hypothetical protein [Symbiobacteriaceae bacterium]
MHFFGDFEAVHNRIVAAAFVSEDGRVEEHWLMKPFLSFRKLDGIYAELLPYTNQELLEAPLLRHSSSRFYRVFNRAEALWFYGSSDLFFFRDSFPDNLSLVDAFENRFVDAKILIEEICTPVYIRNTRTGQMVNFRNIVPYLEEHKINSRFDRNLHSQMKQHLNHWALLLDLPASRWHQALALDEAKIAEGFTPVTYEEIQAMYNRSKQMLHPQQLLPKEVGSELRALRTRLTLGYLKRTPASRLVKRLSARIDAILTIQGLRLSASKMSLESLQKLIIDQKLPLVIQELFQETGISREQGLAHLRKEIGLVNAANLLCPQEVEKIEGVAHNALYDSRLLRVVVLECFRRLEQLKPIIGEF